MAIFLKIDGIPGNVTASGYADWIECVSVAAGGSRSITTASGATANRESSEPVIDAIHVVKSMDKATSPLFKFFVAGGESKNAEIHLMQTGTKLDPYMTYKLEGVLISSYSVSANKDDPSAPYENVALDCTKIEMKYTEYDDKNAAKGNYVAAYDITTTEAS